MFKVRSIYIFTESNLDLYQFQMKRGIGRKHKVHQQKDVKYESRQVKMG